jgi:Tfp pilus assembly protein PilF
MRVALVIALCVLGLAGCKSASGDGPYEANGEQRRDVARALELNGQAADMLQSDPEGAEALLREALTADLFCAPAHNNLGVVFLEQGKLYEAASEFEWARKLLPGHPDPRVNLALVLETAGKTDEALASYEAALEVQPGYLPAIQGAASLVVREGRKDERLRGGSGRLRCGAPSRPGEPGPNKNSCHGSRREALSTIPTRRSLPAAALELPPAAARAWFVAADAYRDRGDPPTRQRGVQAPVRPEGVHLQGPLWNLSPETIEGPR